MQRVVKLKTAVGIIEECLVKGMDPFFVGMFYISKSLFICNFLFFFDHLIWFKKSHYEQAYIREWPDHIVYCKEEG